MLWIKCLCLITYVSTHAETPTRNVPVIESEVVGYPEGHKTGALMNENCVSKFHKKALFPSLLSLSCLKLTLETVSPKVKSEFFPEPDQVVALTPHGYSTDL